MSNSVLSVIRAIQIRSYNLLSFLQFHKNPNLKKIEVLNYTNFRSRMFKSILRIYYSKKPNPIFL